MVFEKASWNIKGSCCSLHFHTVICHGIHGFLQCCIRLVPASPTLPDLFSATLHSQLGGLAMSYRRNRSSRYISLTSSTTSVGSILLLLDMKVRHRRARSSSRTGSADSTLHEVVEIVRTVALSRRRLVLDITVYELVHMPLEVACRLLCTR